jgi:hypothetical protein
LRGLALLREPIFLPKISFSAIGGRPVAAPVLVQILAQSDSPSSYCVCCLYLPGYAMKRPAWSDATSCSRS